MPQQTFFAWNIIISSCTHDGMVMQQLAFQRDAEGLPLCNHLQFSTASKGAWLGKVASPISKNLLHYAKQLQIHGCVHRLCIGHGRPVSAQIDNNLLILMLLTEVKIFYMLLYAVSVG